MLRTFVLAAMVFLTQLPALADRDEKTLSKLIVAAGSTTGMRGNGGKPLGLYLPSQPDVVFRSGYEKQPATTIAQFAYDLADFNHSKGGGYDNFFSDKKEWEAKRAKELADAQSRGEPEAVILAIKARQADSTDPASNKDPNNPWRKAHVSYADQRTFAESWWKNNPAYNQSLAKDWLLNDAILDANDLWASIDTSYADPNDARNFYDHQLKHLLHKH